jgi:hypothetical protein
MVEPADSLYIAPHLDDIYLSCAARLVAEQGQGRQATLVALFDAAGDPSTERDAAVDALLGGRAPRRVRLGLDAQDVDALVRASEALSDLAYGTKAQDVYAPLGVGEHRSHPLVHEAALHACGSKDGRNVFFYEERPEAVVPGAVRMRLAQVGAWLPPGAAHAAESAGLASFLLSFHVPSSLRGELRGWAERLRSSGEATRRWREARAWHPLKGLGPRLQPVVHVAEPGELASVDQLVTAVLPGNARSRPRLRMGTLARQYAQRLGASHHAERLWLLLPTRGSAGLATPHPEALPA